MQDRRREIIDAGLSVLRQHGYAGFTQPRVAALAGLRQSHITYYHPTRLNLLEAVGRAAIDRHLEAVDAGLASVAKMEDAAQVLAAAAVRKENTRVLMALAQAGDEEPGLRELFHELADGLVQRLESLLDRLEGRKSPDNHGRLLHFLIVGSAVVDLARGDPNGQERVAKVFYEALTLISRQRRIPTSRSVEPRLKATFKTKKP